MKTQNHIPPIRSEQRSIGEILYQYSSLRVPPQQTSFSWRRSQTLNFWENLHAVLTARQDTYFLGSMVFVLKSDCSLEVVDGQQRLATVSLLLAALRNAFREAKDNRRANLVQMNYLSLIDHKTKLSSPKLSLNETDSKVYSQIIEGSLSYYDDNRTLKNTGLFEHLHPIIEVYLDLCDFLRHASDGSSKTEYLEKVIEVTTRKISCIQIIADSEDLAYVALETLNDKGLDVSLSDMLRSLLISNAGKHIDELKGKWEKMATVIGPQCLKTFIRHEWMSRMGTVRDKELYKKIEAETKDPRKAAEYVSNLQDAATVYDSIRNPFHPIWLHNGASCQKLLETIRLIGNTECYPLIMSIYFARPKELERMLKWIVSITMRRLVVCKNGSVNPEATYARASSVARRQDFDVDEIRAILQEIWPNDHEFMNSLNESVQIAPTAVKFLFAHIESRISGDDAAIPNPESLIVEHILPKNPGPNWPSRMRSQSFLEEHCDKIGNLTILSVPMKKECESREFEYKKDIYQQSKYAVTRYLCAFDNWTEQDIACRQIELSDIAVGTFNLE